MSFVFISFFTFWLAYHRFFHVKYASKVLDRSKRRANVSGYDTVSLKLAIGHYGGRLLACAGCWFCNDFFFYGNKLFQGNFIKVIAPEASTNVIIGWNYNLINVGVSLVGYYMAAFLIDHKNYGRVHLQGVGFFFCFLCFIIPAFDYKGMTSKGGIHVFQWLYYMSSFFNQFGPNATTFLAPAEVFPASIRSSTHGFSAACGKLGALAPSILYNYVGTRTRFYVVPWFGLVGIFLTYVFLPDMTGMDLREQERYWEYVRAGRAHEYHGIAIHPRHLSLWERFVSKRHLNYNPELDRQAKINELYALCEASQARRQGEKDGHDYIIDEDDESFVSDDVAAFFSKGQGANGYNGNGKYDDSQTGARSGLVSQVGQPHPAPALGEKEYIAEEEGGAGGRSGLTEKF